LNRACSKCADLFSSFTWSSV